MGIRGELFTTQVVLENRSYFFNVKENRTGDVFLQVVESKNKSGEEFDRHAIVVFAEDMQRFFKGLDESLSFIDKDRRARMKAAAEKKAQRTASGGEKKLVYKKRGEGISAETVEKPAVKRTGKVHIVSKRSSGKTENT